MLIARIAISSLLAEARGAGHTLPRPTFLPGAFPRRASEFYFFAAPFFPQLPSFPHHHPSQLGFRCPAPESGEPPHVYGQES